MSRSRCITIFCLASLLPNLGKSQAQQGLWFHALDARQGLAQSFNWYVYHDTQGFVWVSSTDGLNRFDGLQAKQYHSIQHDSCSLLDENVYSDFFEDQKNNIWFSTLGAIHCYVRKHDNFQRFFIYNKHKQLVPGPYKAQFLEQDSFLWVTANSTLYRMNIKRPHDLADSVATTEQFKCRIVLDENGGVRQVYAFGLVNGLEIYNIQNNKEAISSTRRVILPDRFVREVWAEYQNRIWVSSDGGGMYSCNPKAAEPAPSTAFFPGSTVFFTPWQKGHALLAVRGKGIFLLDTERGAIHEINTRFIGQDNSGLHSIKGIYCDRDDNLWLTDESTGLYFANLHKTKFYSIPKLTSGKTNDKYIYWALQEDRDGNVWVGTSPGGVFWLNNKRELIEHFTHDPNDPYSIPSNWVRSIAVDQGNNVYIGTSQGLARFEPKRRRFHIIPEKNAGNQLLINHVMVTSTGRVFASTERAGIYEVVQQKSGATMVEMLSGSSGTFQTIFEGLGQTLYCAKNLQQVDVYSYKNGPLQLIDSLPVSGLVNGFAENTSKGLQYFASSNGLAMLDKAKKTAAPFYYTAGNAPIGKNINSLVADAASNLWLGTNNGLVQFDENTDSFKSFSLADGVQSTAFHLIAALKRENGELWFGGSEGITIVPKNGPGPMVETEPKVIIKRIEINDKEPDLLYCGRTGATNVTLIQQLYLPYSKNTVSFEFAALEYSDPENVRVRFKLAGQDIDWVEVKKGKPFYARYPNLSHGNYTFWLQACNSDGRWGPQTKVLAIRIEPPWYLTWWFLSIVGAVTIALLYNYYLSRVAKIRKEAEIKQLEAELKQKEAEARQKMAETEIAILRLQMNPHFIFNSMNSINAYIHKKDIGTASDYLTRFAALMRMILNLAAKPAIPISDEINFLEQYLKTEAMRFEKKFSYFFEVHPSIDPDDMIIPTMLLQPFVENAIWHGLVKKNGPGTIKIFFSQQDGVLTCIVEDNGIGREAAKKLQDGNVKHESKALGITARRLKLLEEEHHIPSGYEIIDLKDADEKALGTKVVVRLPLL